MNQKKVSFSELFQKYFLILFLLGNSNLQLKVDLLSVDIILQLYRYYSRNEMSDNDYNHISLVGKCSLLVKFVNFRYQIVCTRNRLRLKEQLTLSLKKL